MFGKKSLLPILILLLVFITTVFITVFSGQGGIGDIRNKAAEGPYPSPTLVPCESIGPAGCNKSLYPHCYLGSGDPGECRERLPDGYKCVSETKYECDNCLHYTSGYYCGSNTASNPSPTPIGASHCYEITNFFSCPNTKIGNTWCTWSSTSNSCIESQNFGPDPTRIAPPTEGYCYLEDVPSYNCRSCRYGYIEIHPCVNGLCGQCKTGVSGNENGRLSDGDACNPNSSARLDVNYCGNCPFGQFIYADFVLGGMCRLDSATPTPTAVYVTLTPRPIQTIIPRSTPTNTPRLIPTATLRVFPTNTPRRFPTNNPRAFVTNTPILTPSPTRSAVRSGFYCLLFPNASECKK